MTNGFNTLYEFGQFRLDAGGATLWRNDEVIPLSPKAVGLLRLLIENEGRVVSRQEIFDSLWQDTFVEAGVLTQNIYTLRNALGTDEDGKQFIETVPRRGYRFAGDVKVFSVSEIDRAGFVDENPETLSPDLSKESAAIPPTAVATLTPLVSQSPAIGRGAWFARPVFFSLLGLFVLAAAGFGIYQYAFRDSVKEELKAVAPTEHVRFERLTDSGDVIHPTISPNGETLAYVRVEDNGESVWLKQIATGSSMRVLPSSTNGYRSLSFSADGDFLLFRELSDPGSIFQTPLYGGPPKKVSDNAWSDFSVSPDGKQLAFIRRDTSRDLSLLIVANLDGTGERELASRPGGGGFRGGAPAWSPNGERIVIAISSLNEPRPVLASIETATGNLTELPTHDWRDITRCLWLPNREQLIITARSRDEATSQLWVFNYPDGKVKRLTNDLESYFWTSVTSDGKMLVTRQQRIFAHLWLFEDGDPKKARQLTFGERNADGQAGMTVTPDEKIIFTAFDGKTVDLFSMTLDGERTQLTARPGGDSTWPAISPDGRRIAFTASRTKARQIWIMDADGTNQRQLSFGEEPRQSGAYPAWSPDGREIYFIRSDRGTTAIWKISADGGEPVQVSQLKDAAAEPFLTISPDGKWIAYRHVSTTAENVGEERAIVMGVISSDGSDEPKLFGLPLRRPMVKWAPDSKSFYYSAGTFNASALWRQPIDGSPAEKTFDLPDRLFNFEWSKDGTNLIASRGKLIGDAILITDLP